MQLIRLYANKESFNTIDFNPSGITIILAKTHKQRRQDDKNTYNGLGKSMIIHLVNFCLGSNKIEELETKLPGWEFSLDFIVNNKKYSVTRATDKQNNIILNGKPESLKKYRSILAEDIFRLSEYENIQYLTFRTLLSRFIRPSKISYTDYLICDKGDQKNDYQKYINPCYLIGLEPAILNKKFKLKTELDKQSNAKKFLEEDETFNEFFHSSQNLPELKQDIDKLESDLNNINIAENYYKEMEKVESLNTKLSNIDNQIFILTKQIFNLEKTLSLKIDLPQEKLFNIYEEAKVNFGVSLTKTIDEVYNFKTSLIKERFERLQADKHKLNLKLEDLLDRRSKTGVERDSMLKYLTAHKALDEYSFLNDKLNKLKIKYEKLSSAKKLFNEYTNQILNYEKELADENIKAQKYLLEVEDVLEQSKLLFSQLSNEFYNKPGKLDISNDTGNNKIRYKINTYIDFDSSDGINAMKIFCFDILLLLNQRNHNMNCIFHDSRLFGNTDTKQLSILFAQVQQLFNGTNNQYICTLNENTLRELKTEMNEEDYSNVILKNVCRTVLTDESSTTKLLGIEVKMNLDK